ncbi:MAG: hypothetical protein JXA25_05405, partial [Anaerolineales bacterium]|nr:hypothetical protein [Anaerolineales bacterium]
SNITGTPSFPAYTLSYRRIHISHNAWRVDDGIPVLLLSLNQLAVEPDEDIFPSARTSGFCSLISLGTTA